MPQDVDRPHEPHGGDQRASFADVVRVRTLLPLVAHEEVEIAQAVFAYALRSDCATRASRSKW